MDENKVVTKKWLVSEIKRRLNEDDGFGIRIYDYDAETIANVFIDIFRDVFIFDLVLRLYNLGSFYNSKQKAKKYKDFKTGKMEIAPPRRVPKFSPSNSFKKEIREN